MKKSIIALAICACAAVAIAAFDATKLTAVNVIAPTSISAGTTNATVVSSVGYKGKCGVYVSAAPAVGRVLDITVYSTNRVSGGWSVYAHGVAPTNTAVYTLPFTGEYATDPLKVGIGAIGANATVSAFILGTK